MNWKIEKLRKGETFVTKEYGNSMTPLIKSGQEHKLSPITLEEVNVGDIIYCKVKKSIFTHLVKAKNEKLGVLIGNNHGKINGWTKHVYGKVIEIL